MPLNPEAKEIINEYLRQKVEWWGKLLGVSSVIGALTLFVSVSTWMSNATSVITDNVKREVQASFERERLAFIDRVRADAQEISAARKDVLGTQIALQRIRDIDLKSLDQEKIEALSKALRDRDVSQLATLISETKAAKDAVMLVQGNQEILKICILEFVGVRRDAIPVPSSAKRSACAALREALYPVKESPNHSHDKILIGFACAKGDNVRRVDDRQPQENECRW